MRIDASTPAISDTRSVGVFPIYIYVYILLMCMATYGLNSRYPRGPLNIET